MVPEARFVRWDGNMTAQAEPVPAVPVPKGLSERAQPNAIDPSFYHSGPLQRGPFGRVDWNPVNS